VLFLDDTVNLTGMDAIVSQLTTGITAETIFGVVGDVMPFVIIMIPVACYFILNILLGGRISPRNTSHEEEE